MRSSPAPSLRPLALIFACALGLGSLAGRAADELAPIVLPVRVHIMHSETDLRLNTTLVEADVQRIFGKVNKVWAQAGIRFEIESIGPTLALEKAPAGAPRKHPVAAVMPAERLLPYGLNVLYVKEMESNGVWTGQMAVIKDTSKVKPVENGLDEPIPRVTSHELGHALGLPHRQDVLNLMASGRSGFALNEEEIKIARTKAQERASKAPGAAQPVVAPVPVQP